MTGGRMPGHKDFGGYGTNATYLVGRIARDRPDILERMMAGEYNATGVRHAARDAGILRGPLSPEDKGLERLLEAWSKAGLQDRQLFLALLAEEIEAASRGEYLSQVPPRRGGPPPYNPAAGAEIPELEALLQAGRSVSEIASRLGVTYRTIARWRASQSRPSQALREKLIELAKGGVWSR
jgi:hypothetical protein